MMFIIYDIIYILYAVLYFPYLVIRGKWHSGFKMRFGCFAPSLVERFAGNRTIWFHAVSVGEVLAVADLIRRIRGAFPQYRIVCSTVTQTGNRLAQEHLGNDAVVLYAPLDLSPVVRRFIAVIRPKIYIAAETEIWPNLYTALCQKGVPVIQINGRISDKAFRGYKRVAFLMKRVLDCVDLFCMQSPLDADRIRQMGAAPEKVRVVGNLKFDNIPPPVDMRKEDLGFHADEDLLIAGSTHPGEEDILLGVYGQLAEEFRHLRLVIAPRHVERAGEVMRLAEGKGHTAVRFSQIRKGAGNSTAVVVVDTIGHLRTLYGLAKVVFIGKTLAVGGGQNVIEPACFGKPTIVGPLTQNFKDVVGILLKAQALIQVNDAHELLMQIRDLLAGPEKAERIGEAARQTVKKYQGATLRTVEAITGLLNR